MDAWQVLISNSTAPNGSDAWEHLNAQEGGGTTVFVNGFDAIVESTSINTTVDVPKIEVIMAKQDIRVTTNDPIKVTIDNQAVTVTLDTTVDVTLGCK